MLIITKIKQTKTTLRIPYETPAMLQMYETKRKYSRMHILQ